MPEKQLGTYFAAFYKMNWGGLCVRGLRGGGGVRVEVREGGGGDDKTSESSQTEILVWSLFQEFYDMSSSSFFNRMDALRFYVLFNSISVISG